MLFDVDIVLPIFIGFFCVNIKFSRVIYKVTVVIILYNLHVLSVNFVDYRNTSRFVSVILLLPRGITLVLRSVSMFVVIIFVTERLMQMTRFVCHRVTREHKLHDMKILLNTGLVDYWYFFGLGNYSVKFSLSSLLVIKFSYIATGLSSGIIKSK